MPFVIHSSEPTRPFEFPERPHPLVGAVGEATAIQSTHSGSTANKHSAAVRAAKHYQSQNTSDNRAQLERVVTVAQIMTSPVVTVTPDLTLIKAREIFLNHRFRHLPVCTVQGNLVGMLSDRDLLAHEQLQPGGWVIHEMTDRVVTATEDTSVREVAQAMINERISAMPVSDNNDHLTGIVTTSDLLNCIANESPLAIWA